MTALNSSPNTNPNPAALHDTLQVQQRLRRDGRAGAGRGCQACAAPAARLGLLRSVVAWLVLPRSLLLAPVAAPSPMHWACLHKSPQICCRTNTGSLPWFFACTDQVFRLRSQKRQRMGSARFGQYCALLPCGPPRTLPLPCILGETLSVQLIGGREGVVPS